MIESGDNPSGATPLSADDVRGLRFRHITTREQLDELEQANVVQGLRWLASEQQGDILDEIFVRKIHKQLFGEVWVWAGTYRLRETNIGVAPHQITEQMRLLLDDARLWCERRIYTPLEAAVRFHHRMVLIHPFPNGNGRHARIVTDEFLKRCFKLPPIEWASGFDLERETERREAYLRALGLADTGNLEALLEFVDVEKSGREN